MCGTFGVTSHIPQLFLCSGPLPSWGPLLRLLGKGRGGRSQEGAWPGVPGPGLRVVGVLGASLPGSSEHQACHLQAGLGSAGSQEQRLAPALRFTGSPPRAPQLPTVPGLAHLSRVPVPWAA